MKWPPEGRLRPPPRHFRQEKARFVGSLTQGNAIVVRSVGSSTLLDVCICGSIGALTLGDEVCDAR